MSYYRGDYYRGDGGNYYKGDPFLPVLGALAVGAGKKLLGKAGRWVGRQTVGGLIGKGAGTVAAGAVVSRATRGREIVLDVDAAMPGGEPMLELRRERKKYRRMNPLNPKALKRGIRRLEGFEKFARSTMSALYKPGSTRKYKKTSKRS